MMVDLRENNYKFSQDEINLNVRVQWKKWDNQTLIRGTWYLEGVLLEL